MQLRELVMPGIAVRRALWDYLRLYGLMIFILLVVAWSIDLANQFRDIRARADAERVPLVPLLVEYLFYRTVDMLNRLSFQAYFFGIYLAEILRRRNLETVILAAAGASPRRMFQAIVIFGILLGAVQYKLEADWRPAAVFAQVEREFGSYYHRFRDHLMGRHRWFIGEDTALRARVLRDDPPALVDVTIFQGLSKGDLDVVLTAERADPAGAPLHWHLSDLRVWDLEGPVGSQRDASNWVIALDILRTEIRYYDIPSFYLPTPALHDMVRHLPHDRTVWARSALWRRRTVWILPGLLAFLAAGLAREGFSGRQMNVTRLIGMAVFGYLLVASIKIFWTMGELGSLPAWLAAMLPVMLIAAGGVYLHRRQS